MKYKETPLKDITAYISKGIVPKYASQNDTNIIRVLNQRCNRNNLISLSNSRFNNLDKRNVPNEKVLKENDVLINSTGVGTAGRVAQVNDLKEKMTVDGHMIIIRPTKTVNPVFYGYAVIANQYKIEQLAEGSTGQTEINRDRLLKDIYIKLPSLDIQNKIANNLRILDNKISLNNQINANLLELAKTLFSEEFSSNEEVLLSNYLLPKRGKNLLKKNVVSGEFPVIAGGLKPAAFHNSYNTKAPVITISASGANAGYVQIWGQPVWSSDSSYIDTSITKDIYFWYLLLKKYQKQIFDAQTGSAQPHIYPKHIGNLLIPNISEDSIKNFNITITPIFKKIFQNKNENNKLKAIKNSLLIKYFN